MMCFSGGRRLQTGIRVTRAKNPFAKNPRCAIIRSCTVRALPIPTIWEELTIPKFLNVGGTSVLVGYSVRVLSSTVANPLQPVKQTSSPRYLRPRLCSIPSGLDVVVLQRPALGRLVGLTLDVPVRVITVVLTPGVAPFLVLQPVVEVHVNLGYIGAHQHPGHRPRGGPLHPPQSETFPMIVLISDAAAASVASAAAAFKGDDLDPCRRGDHEER